MKASSRMFAGMHASWMTPNTLILPRRSSRILGFPASVCANGADARMQVTTRARSLATWRPTSRLARSASSSSSRQMKTVYCAVSGTSGSSQLTGRRR